MKSLVVKRSIVVAGHKTSVSLEDETGCQGLRPTYYRLRFRHCAHPS